jgi:putative heme iron utilization protein
MLMGTAAVTTDPAALRRYLTRHPDAEMYAGFADFALYEVTLKGAHLVAGFGRIVDLSPSDLLTDTADAETLIAAEPEVIAHMNTDHAEACRLYATRLLGAPDGDWRCVGCDPEGLDLQLDRAALRLWFPQRITGPGPLRATLKQLAEQARAAG